MGSWAPPLQGVLPFNIQVGMEFFCVVYLPVMYGANAALGWLFDRLGWFSETQHDDAGTTDRRPR